MTWGNMFHSQVNYYGSVKYLRHQNYLGSVAGRRCSGCTMLEMTLVEGDSLDKSSGVDLEECVQLCNDRFGCSHFNYYYSKIPTDPWSRCVLVSSSKNNPVIRKNKNYVLSGDKCSGQSQVYDPPRVDPVTQQRGMSLIGADLKSFSNIVTLTDCISLCHLTKHCQGYEYVGDGDDQWNKNVCHLKYQAIILL